MAVNNLFTKSKVNLLKPDEPSNIDSDFQDNDTKTLISKINKINGKLNEFKFMNEKFFSAKGGAQIPYDKKYHALISKLKNNPHFIHNAMEDNGKIIKNSL